MQKKKQHTPVNGPEIQEREELHLEYQLEDEQTMLTRASQSGGSKRKQGRALGFSPQINFFLLTAYVLLIIVGWVFGRWLYNRNQNTLNSPAAISQPVVAEAVATEPATDATDATDGTNAPTTSSGFTCPASQSAQVPASSELNMLVWTEYLPSDWFECFEMLYNVKINRTEFSSNDEMLAIFAENLGKFDLLQPSDQGVTTLIAQGSLAELNRDLLSAISNINPAFMNPPYDPGNKYSLPYQAGSIALAVNSTKINPLPTAWADLWKSEYAGRLLLMEDANDVIGVTLLANGYPFNSTDPAQLEAIKPKLAELFKAAKTLNSDSQSTDILNGDIDLGLFWNGEAALAQRDNDAIHYVYPTEGAILWQDNYVIPANSTHSDAAYAWINYTMQGDMFWMMLRDFPYTNPNQASLDFAKTHHPELYQEYFSSTVTNVPTQAVLNGHWLVDLGEGQALYDALWAEMTASK